MSYRNKNCLVTGGAGFIGSNLVLRLVQEGARVTVLDSFVEGLGGNSFNLEAVRDGIELVQADQRDAAIVERVVSEKDFIFNLTGNVSHQDSMKAPLFDLDVNVLAHVSLLEACRAKNRHATIVYSSTRQLYGVPQYLPVDEEHPIEPVDVNGINKHAAEQYHALYSRVHGLKTIVLRLTNTYGPRQLIKHSRQGFVGWFVNRVVTANPIQLYGTGEQLRDFNFVDDVVEAMLLAAGSSQCVNGIFNLSGERASLARVAQLLVQAVGKGSFERVEFPVDVKKIDIGDFYGTSEKLRRACGWTAKIPLEEGMRAMVDYYERHKSHYL